MKFYGLTGGIASGKSAVTKILRDEGIEVLDMDQISRDVLQPGSPGLEHIVDTFGAGYITLDGSLDRKKLADLVFNDKIELAKLDNLMGPLMWDDVVRQREAASGDLVFLDAALLIEKGMHEHVDGIVLVTAPVDVRVRRAMKRDRASEAQIRARMSAQMDDEEKRRLANFVIENTGTVQELRGQVLTVLENLCEPF